MVKGFLKGIWGKPASQGTGMVGLWGTVKRTPSSVFNAMTSPIKLMKGLIMLIIAVLIYARLKK